MADNRKVIAGIAVAGVAATLLVGAVGRSVERLRFGVDDRASVLRVQEELTGRFAAAAETLQQLTSRVATSPELIRSAARDPAAARQLFDSFASALPTGSAAGISLYVSGTPLAWAGQVTDLPREQIEGPARLFVAPSAPGPRLVRVEPVVDRERRVASIVAEQALGRVGATPSSGDAFTLSTSLVPASLRVRASESPRESPYSFAIAPKDGRVLVDAEVSAAELAGARARWQHGIRAMALSTLGITLLLCATPVILRRRRASGLRPLIGTTALVAALLIAARFVFWMAAEPIEGPHSPVGPVDLTVSAMLLAALVWLMLDLVERRRTMAPRWTLASGTRALVGTLVLYLLVGALGIVLLGIDVRALRNLGSQTGVDLLHFSLHPLDRTRLLIAASVVLLHAGVVWLGALGLRLAAVTFRHPRSAVLTGATALLWATGIIAAARLAPSLADPGFWRALLPPLLAMWTCVAALGRYQARFRRASQATRLAVLFLAIVVPALAMYPTLHVLAVEAKERLVEEQFGPQAARLRDDLQNSMRRALEAIDAVPALGNLIKDAPAGGGATDQAFQLWSRTDLARFRLTSAVELYAADGRLASRFALVPDYPETSHEAATCDWDIVDETSPFGSSERHILRASRGVCERGRRLGSVVVRAMLDYRTLPFIAPRSPYLGSLGLDRASAEGTPGQDVEFVMYGWSRAPMHVSGTDTWPLPDSVFDRMLASREPMWATLSRDGETFRVYFLNDRGGIYALGYPVITWFGHLVNLAELVTLVGALYVLLLAAASLVAAFGPPAHAGGRALFREVRSSFYRKLFLAFVAAAVAPVIVLALATRAYFANQFRAEIQEGAVQTTTVAQRLLEDYATLQQRETGALGVADDQFMVLVGRAIDQSVNLFDRQRLQATSDRDLFATGFLSTRTPAEVYRSIVLDRLPTFVGEEEAGGSRYLVAAAPVRAGGREGIVTVPQTLREQEVEERIDDLDRRVLFASVLFVLVGASLGYWMAERIADPVNRLTRATRRVARGELDARVAAASADELGRLVQDFNRMAADLQRQRTELERTQRLEAWAEMARLVAHDIKNPLTPIQLSAEHAKRVNLDRGRPLSPVLDECVDVILKQVRLLRQISSEFSSFASSPAPRPEPTDLRTLIEDVLEPYRTALAERVAIDVQSSDDLPEVIIDRTLFARALTNVIENSLHAMPRGGRLAIAASAGDGADSSPASSADRTPSQSGETSRVGQPATRRRVIVEIKDTGVGIDRESLARIFQPYFSTKATGTGLGMTIAKRNVELNGGTIAIDSEPGVGTTVTISLPV